MTMTETMDDWKPLHERARKWSAIFGILALLSIAFGLGVFSGGQIASPDRIPLKNAGVFGVSMMVALALFIASVVVIERDSWRLRRRSEYLRRRREATYP
jgi:hypothetical protein